MIASLVCVQYQGNTLTRTGISGRNEGTSSRKRQEFQKPWLAASFLMIVLLRLLGAASFEGAALHGQAFLKSALLWAAAFLLLGFAEEFAYRGYSQTALTDGMGFWPAAVLLSAIFGAVHYFFKPMENWMDGLSVGLFGLFWLSLVKTPCNR
jgi:membrane protease YdiL (CAAX protease family)